MRFMAIDVETANADTSSICAIGVAEFADGVLEHEQYTLIDPQDYFDPINIDIHGIDQFAVESAPTFAEIAPAFLQRIDGSIVVTHTHFDRVAIHRALERCGHAAPTCRWLDTARVARRTWPDCAHSGYGLRALCDRLGFAFQHHHALEDAKAAAHVLLAAMAETNLDLEAILHRVKQSISGTSDRIKLDGNPHGPLAGEVVAFTGALDIPRAQAAKFAADLGCTVNPNVSLKTTLLVVGDLDVRHLAGRDKSAKHRKAEDLISKGCPIRILSEAGFMKLVSVSAE